MLQDPQMCRVTWRQDLLLKKYLVSFEMETGVSQACLGGQNQNAMNAMSPFS